MVVLEKEMAVHSSILSWRIPWTDEPGSYSPWGLKESDMTDYFFYTYLDIIFWRKVSGLNGVAQSRT